ncbi:hypothetical protein ACGFSI_41445 [Streptomyces virginiae]|uniref:hypothetical protein n=1 Tax=Streptomyces virginiae TaxID=1961 RepID=UPI00371FDDA7
MDDTFPSGFKFLQAGGQRVKPYDAFDQAAVALLADLPAWRLRAIERVELSSAFWSLRDREIHTRPLADILATHHDLRSKLVPHRTSADTFELILPIAELPKIPLLDLTITIDGEPVYRVAKDESARIEARYVIQLASEAHLMKDEFAFHPEVVQHFIDFLAALFYFPAHPYEEVWKKYHRLSFKDADSWLVSYFADEQHEYLSLRWRHFFLYRYPQWQPIAEQISEVAKTYVVSDYLSGAENPLIALPYLIQEIKEEARSSERVMTLHDIDAMLGYLGDLIGRAHRAAQRGDAAARKFISAYFAYGYRWMAFAKCKVPVDRPFIIEMKERRAIYFSAKRKPRYSPNELRKKEACQMVAFADAETNHVSIRVADTAVRMMHCPKVFDESLNEVTGGVDEEASTFELYLRQDSSRIRPERIYIKCPLRLTRLHSAMLWLTMFVTALGIFLLWNRGLSSVGVAPPHDPTVQETPLVAEGLTAKDATLILVPVAFAASFLLIRDTSTLSAWIRRVRQSVLLIELLALLGTAFVLLWIHHIRIGG